MDKDKWLLSQQISVMQLNYRITSTNWKMNTKSFQNLNWIINHLWIVLFRSIIGCLLCILLLSNGIILIFLHTKQIVFLLAYASFSLSTGLTVQKINLHNFYSLFLLDRLRDVSFRAIRWIKKQGLLDLLSSFLYFSHNKENLWGNWLRSRQAIKRKKTNI